MEYYSLPDSAELNTLEACVVIEESCAIIYRHFATLFSDSSDIAKIWTELAEEEDQHAEKFRSAVRTHGSRPKCIENDNYLIEGIVHNLTTLITDMKQNPPEQRDAFITAAILEHSVEKYHVETGKLLVDAELSELLSDMAHKDRCHMEMLERVAHGNHDQ